MILLRRLLESHQTLISETVIVHLLTPNNDGTRQWFEQGRGGIDEKISERPNLFREFSGFESPFQSQLTMDTTMQRGVRQRDITGLMRC
jgi:hypothetical protein